MKNFHDPYYGGMYWSVTSDGNPLVERKQIYGNAFAIYALSEYAAAIKELRDEDEASKLVMDQALEIYNLIEQHAYDGEYGGYYEARARNWDETEETKLSEKDLAAIDSLMAEGHYILHHSRIFNETYHPHYRIINRHIFEQQLKPALEKQQKNLHF